MGSTLKSAARLLVPLGGLAMLGGFPFIISHAEEKSPKPTIDVVTPPDAAFDISRAFEIQVLARNAPMEIVGAQLAVLDDNTGASLNSAFKIASATAGIEAIKTISVAVEQQKVAQTVSAKGSIALQFRAQGSKTIETGPRWTFRMIRPAPDVTVAAHPIALTREMPFTDIDIGTGKTSACLAYQAIPTLLALRADLDVPGEVYSAGNDASRISGLDLRAKIANSQLCLTTSIPGRYTALKGKLWLRPPEVNKPLDVDVDLRVKDHWRWRALAVAVSTLFALGLMYWTNQARRRLLNRAQRDEISNRLAQFLAANPALANHDSVVFVRQLLLDSSAFDREGEFDLSVQNLQSASARLDSLFASPPAAPVALATSGQAIRIVNAPLRLLTGERIVFVIGEPNPAWPARGGNYSWKVADQAGAPMPGRQGVNLTTFTKDFKSAATYQVQVTVNGANPETRSFTILNRPAEGLIRKFKLATVVAIVVAFVLAAGTAFVSTEDAATFGTPGDYLKLLVTAFGVAGAGGVTAIFAALRRG